MNPSALGFLRAVRVIARIATVAQDHSGLIAGVSTPHEGAIVRHLPRERLLLDGDRVDGIGAGRGEWSEPSMQPETGPEFPLVAWVARHPSTELSDSFLRRAVASSCASARAIACTQLAHYRPNTLATLTFGGCNRCAQLTGVGNVDQSSCGRAPCCAYTSST